MQRRPPTFGLILWCLAQAFIHGAPSAYPASESPTPSWPQGISLPWRDVGIDPSESALARAALQAHAQALAAAWLKAPAPLTDLAKARAPLTINMERALRLVRWGSLLEESASSLPTLPPLVVEPVWCSIMDFHVFALTVSHAESGALLAVTHRDLPRTTWEVALKSKAGIGQLLRDEITPLLTPVLAQAIERAAAPATSALHIGLALAASIDRRDEGTSLCLNLLLEGQIAQRYQVARSLGPDQLATLRTALALPSKLLRPSRTAVLNWARRAEKPAVEGRILPQIFDVSMTLAETVFGHHIPANQSFEIKVSPPGPDSKTVAMAPFEPLTTLFDAEAQSLSQADPPMAARIDRAWVYLDRGRAWGLRMNDRLVATVNGQAVKGHVVRFFGPEAALTSPRGYPIREGAIVYVRRGQKLPKVGTPFALDTTTFPAPYKGP